MKRATVPNVVMRPSSDARRAAEARADALLAEIADDELDALATSLARLLLSAARNRRRQEGEPVEAAS